MKIMVNYDFMDRICIVKDNSKFLKVIKDEKQLFAIGISFLFTINFLTTQSIFTSLCTTFLIGSPVAFHSRFSKENIQNIELRAFYELHRLSVMFQDLNIKTNYELLLESYIYERKYKLCLDENKLPYILESKYIMIPSYDYNGDIDEESIVQDHVVGSKEYVITLDRPNKEMKLVYSGA